MKKFVFVLLLTFASMEIFAQYKMRKIEELINPADFGWIFLRKWIDSATNKVEVIPADSLSAKDALFKTQVTTRSIMGAVVYHTGGLLIDNGWIRILGSGSNKMHRSLPDWNKGKAFKNFGDDPIFFLVADDAAGGFFAINYGNFGKDLDSIYYLSPESLLWEALGMNYEDFIWFCFKGDLKRFYSGIRWSTWKGDLIGLNADQVFHIFPPLWSREGKNIEKSQRNPVPVEEHFSYTLDLRKKMGLP